MPDYFDLENAIIKNPFEWRNIFADHINGLSIRSPQIAELILRHGDPVAILRLEGTVNYCGAGEDYWKTISKSIGAKGMWIAEEYSTILQGYTTIAKNPTDGSVSGNVSHLNNTRLLAYAANYDLPTYMLLYGVEQSISKKLLRAATRQRTLRGQTYSFFDSGRQIYLNQDQDIGKHIPLIEN